MRKARDRHGRFLKKGHGGSSKRRKKARRKHGRRSGGRKRRRAAPRSSNPPRRRRRSRSAGRRRNSPRGRSRTRTVYKTRYRSRNRPRRHKKHARRRNPPYTIATTLIALGLSGVGFGITKAAPMLLAKATGRMSLNQGWEGVGVAAGSALVVTLVGYGIGRLVSTKRTANMVAGTLAVGGALAVGHDAIEQIRKAKAPAPAPKPPLIPTKGVSGTGPLGLITPADLARARTAASMLGLGNITPADAADARNFASFPAETNF